MTGLKPMRCVSAASMFHVLEELFDFKLWESARGIEGKPSPHVSQPNAPMPSLLHYVFQFWAPGLAGRVSETSDAVYRSRERQLDCTQVQRAESCVLPKKNVNMFCLSVIFHIFVFLWYVDMIFQAGKSNTVVLQSCLAESRSFRCLWFNEGTKGPSFLNETRSRGMIELKDLQNGIKYRMRCRFAG